MPCKLTVSGFVAGMPCKLTVSGFVAGDLHGCPTVHSPLFTNEDLGKIVELNHNKIVVDGVDLNCEALPSESKAKIVSVDSRYRGALYLDNGEILANPDRTNVSFRRCPLASE